MSSGAHLVRALERIGFKQVERHAQPQPLLSWRGQPVGVDAEVIVRRSQIGATADDLGFTRGANGKFEAIVSNILLSRLDRRWFEKLSEHYDAAVAEDGGGPDAPEAPPAPRAESASARAPQPAPSGTAPSERRSERTTRREFEPAPRRESERGPRNESERVPRGESERREQGGPAPRTPERVPPARPEEFKAAVREAVDAVIAAPATAATAAGASGPDLKREIGAVLAVARAAGGGGMGRSCMVHLALWFGLVVLSAVISSGKPLLFGSFVLVFLFVKKANERRQRMVEAALSELRTRLRYDVELRAQVLRELRRTLEEQSGEMRPLVQDLVKRIETSPLK